jgi:competence protein ComEC
MRPPILWIAVAFGAGLWAGLGFLGLWGAEAFLVIVPPLVGAAWLWRAAPLGAALGIMGVAGMIWGVAATRSQGDGCAGRWSDQPGRSHAAVVRLFDPAPATGGVVVASAIGQPCRGTLKLKWPTSRPGEGGTTWLVAGRWLGTGHRGIFVVRRARLLDSVPRGRGALRGTIARRSAELFGTRASLVDALMIGRTGEVDPKVRERYSRSGLAHLLSISGLHVGFLAAWLVFGLERLRVPRRPLFVAATALVLGYVWLLGWPAPAGRAALMLAIDGVSRLRQRVVAPRGTIACAVLLLLFADPWALHSIGAWLSVAAIAAVIWGTRVTKKNAVLVRLLVPSIAATLITAPITAFAFGTVAPVGVALNLAAVPLAAVAVPGLAIALAMSWIAEPIAALLAAGSGLGLALLDLIAAAGAQIPGGHVIHAPGLRAAGLWAVIALVAWWLWRSPRRGWTLAARVALVLAVLTWSLFFRRVSLDDCRCLTVHFLNVGQGDAAVLRTPADRWVVIDGGPRFGDRDAGRSVVVPFLRRHGVDSLAAVVATHGDADHLGGLPAVIEAFPPRFVLEPGEPLARPLYLEFLAAVEGSGAHWQPARAGDRLDLDGVTLEVLSPDSAWLALPMDVNEHSVVLRVSYGAERALFAGDAGHPVEERLVGRVGPVRLLKIGHHGSRSATSAAWLEELEPREAVISVGARNRYGHPAPEVLERLDHRGVSVLRTDRHGTITILLDGQRGAADIRRNN